jgi:hypothetical protein
VASAWVVASDRVTIGTAAFFLAGLVPRRKRSMVRGTRGERARTPPGGADIRGGHCVSDTKREALADYVMSLFRMYGSLA